jgi:hypothetical protein
LAFRHRAEKLYNGKTCQLVLIEGHRTSVILPLKGHPLRPFPRVAVKDPHVPQRLGRHCHEYLGSQGPMLRVLQLLTLNKNELCKNLIMTLVFEGKRKIFMLKMMSMEYADILPYFYYLKLVFDTFLEPMHFS